jgi:hypothetical protein
MWRVPALLVALSIMPALGAVARVASLSTGVPSPETARFFAAPAPVVLHVVAATVFSMVGAFQFSAGVRRRWPRWHRLAGRGLAAMGLLAALTGTWMTMRYAIPERLQGPLLFGVRLIVGLAMAISIGLAWLAIRRRDVQRHQAWMIRAYALGQGAGTQAVLMLAPSLISGEMTYLIRDVLMVLAWVINVGTAEWIIRGIANTSQTPSLGATSSRG